MALCMTISPRISLACFAVSALLATGACDQKSPSSTRASGVTAASPAVPTKTAATVPTAGQPSPSATAKRMDAPATDNDEASAGTPDIGSVSITADDASNHGAATQVDVVLAYDPAAATEIGALKAAEWFEKRGTFTVNDRAQVFSWSVAPGGHIAETEVDPDNVARAAFVFARYATPGDHRQKIDGAGSLNIHLGAEDFTAELSQE